MFISFSSYLVVGDKFMAVSDIELALPEVFKDIRSPYEYSSRTYQDSTTG